MDYTKIKEIKLERDIEIVNELLKKDWVLLIITKEQEELYYLIGRISYE